MKHIPIACAAATAAALLGSGGENVGISVGFGVIGVGAGDCVGRRVGNLLIDGMIVEVGLWLGANDGGTVGSGVLGVGSNVGSLVGKRSI